MLSKDRDSTCLFMVGPNLKGLYIWSAIYVLVIHMITRIGIPNSLVVFAIYSIMAIPFINNIDKFISMCYIISPITYYYTGTDEGLLSIYTIFIILAIVNIIFRQKINYINIIPFIITGIAVYISFSKSEFHYANGAFLLIYVIIVSLLISISNSFKKDTLLSFIPFLACLQVYIFTFELIAGGVMSDGRFSISQLVDYNTFGMAVSQMATVLIAQWIINEKPPNLLYKIAIILSVFITILSGSRNALLGLVGSFIVIYIYKSKLNGQIISKTFRLILGLCFLGCIILILTPILGLDLTRFNYIELIQSGGTNRTTIWMRIIPLIIEKYLFFGYGPGHYCSSVIVSKLVNREYVHTHNLIIEVWGELGLIGLIPFLWIIINAFKSLNRKIKVNDSNLIIMAIFIELIINCIGESHFCDIILWIIIGFANCRVIWRKVNE